MIAERLPARFARLVETCSACPSQWDAWDDEGRYFYIRYRWGVLSVESAEGPDEYVHNHDVSVLYERQLGDPLDGVMDEATMLRHVRDQAVLDTHPEIQEAIDRAMAGERIQRPRPKRMGYSQDDEKG